MGRSTRRYAILGSGALGGYYGALLHRAGLPVDFLCRGDYDHVREHGWTVESKHGDFRIPKPSVYRDARDMPPADVAVVALKTTSNGQLPSLLPPVVKPDGVVLVLQNGLGMEDLAAAIVGPGRVIGGSCFLCSNKVGPGWIRHLDYGTIAMGEHTADGSPGGLTDRLRAIAADFEAAGVRVQISDDLRQVRWKKLVWNIPFNGLSVVLDASTSDLVGDRSLRTLVRDVMEEIAGAAAAVGVAIEPEFLDSMIANTERMVPYKTSMKVDYDGGRPLEVDSIFGEPLRRAAAAGAAMPITSALHRQLHFLDERNRKNRET